MMHLRTVPWRPVVAALPLPMLALAASYGVFSFNLLFAPWWIAFVSAAAFELVYVGLAVLGGLDSHQRRRASAISIGAVAVSVVYNSLAGLFHRRPELLIDLPIWAEAVLAILHGLPLALVAYLTADLLLHRAPAVEDAPGYPAPVLVAARSGDAPQAVAKACVAPTGKAYHCPHCSATLPNAGALGSAVRRGYCRACKPAA